MGSGFWSIMLYLQEPLETGPSTGVGKESQRLHESGQETP